MKRNLITCAIAAIAIIGMQSDSFAQATDSDTQTYILTVNSLVSIDARQDPISITHDGNDTNQAFPRQTWDAFCNTAAGATVTFTSQSAFVNTVGGSTFTREAQLDLALGTNVDAGWAVTVASDSTTPADDNAVVSAASNASGSAELDLTVTFLDTDYSQLPAGTYTMTVEGLITAN